MQPLLEIAPQAPDAISTINQLATQEEQKETNLSKLLIITYYISHPKHLRCKRKARPSKVES